MEPVNDSESSNSETLLERFKPRRGFCVDDEESILKGFRLHLRKGFDLFTANSGEDGLRVFDEEGGFAVVLSDMRMPGIDGAVMLSSIKERNADVVTMLLTGHADFESAMSAVNDGNVFRMLSKPCPPERLIQSLYAGLRQHELIVGETLDAKRKDILNRFGDEHKSLSVIVNHQILATGIDVPGMNSIMILSRINSPSLALQVLGRAMRGKKNGGNLKNTIFLTKDNEVTLTNFNILEQRVLNPT